MSTLVNLTMAPFALILRLAHGRPWLAIVVSSAAGIVAALLHRELWMSLFVCFAAYLLMYLDEIEHPVEQVEIGTADTIE